jgi:GNAT superfamily N-acetyltransferase
MNTARKLELATPPVPSGRLFRMGRRQFLLAPLEPGEPKRIAEEAGAHEFVRVFEPDRWVVGLSAARPECPEDRLGFYAVAHSGEPTCFDDTLIFVKPSARGLGLSHLLIYGVHLELLRKSLSFRLREAIDQPRLRLFGRCGFAPPVRPLVDGKVEVSNYDLHAILSRIEAEDEVAECPGGPAAAFPYTLPALPG